MHSDRVAPENTKPMCFRVLIIFRHLPKGKVKKMKCEYCGKEFSGRRKKYCSRECCREADKANKRMQYVWKSDRADACVFCGEPLGKGRVKYCSSFCARKDRNIKQGRISHSEVLTKNCCVCGKEFQTWRSRKTTCSEECRRKRDVSARSYDAEYEHQKYLKKHPNAKTAEQRHEEHLLRLEKQKEEKAEKAIAMFLQEVEWESRRANKKRIKEANRKYWQEYEQEHTCVECGEKYIAHYPTSKYCSPACQRRVTKTRRRYKDITVDKGITLRRLAKRDRDRCQICGGLVDWNDKYKTDKTIITGNQYPSIDHIIPIAHGGVHSWGNVQLAHRICNTIKKDKIV